MRTLVSSSVHDQEIKHSRFRARAVRIDDPNTATTTLLALSDPEATHNCWAWRIGARYRFSDDGEPGGTAGRPILAAIEKRDLDHVLVVVTRWYGGIKLGAGGLARAYGGTSARCLARAEVELVYPQVRIRAAVPFAHTSTAYRVVATHGGSAESEEWTESGLVLVFSVDEPVAEDAIAALVDATRGQASAARLNT